jgi:hypothetical protein
MRLTSTTTIAFLFPLSRELKILTGKLDARGIMTIRRRHSVNPLTFGTLAHKRGQGKAGAASLAIGGQSAIGNELIPNAAAMGIINKFDKFAADRKRSAAASAASASSHNESSKIFIILQPLKAF